MGVRFVSVGRANAGSNMTYSVALLTYSRGTTPGVEAMLQLPDDVELISVSPSPDSAPPPGGTGLVYWNLGALAGPANRPLEVNVRVRNEGTLGTIMVANLYVQNGIGESFALSRVSRVGGYDTPLTNKVKTSAFTLAMTAPRMVRPDTAVTYSVAAKSALKTGFSTPRVNILTPPGIVIGSMLPPPTAMEVLPNGSTLLEWQFSHPGKAIRLKVNATADSTIHPGDILEAFATVSDGEDSQGTVVATQSVP